MFCDRFKQLHDSSGLTNKQLGDIIGVSEYTISKYRNGTREPSFQILNRIADFFEVSTDYLLERTDIKTVDDSITLNSIKTKFKNYPTSVSGIIDTVFAIITYNGSIENLDALDAILKELHKVMKK